MKKLLPAFILGLLMLVAIAAVGPAKYVGTFYGSFSGSNNINNYWRSQARLYKNEINVRDFGAVGNGVTSDTLAFQLCANLTSNRWTIYVPPGDYVITNTITFPPTGISPTNREIIYGDSSANTRILAHTITNGNAFSFPTYESGGNLVSGQTWKIRGLGFYGPFYWSGFNFNQFSLPFSNLVSVPFRGAGIFTGRSGNFIGSDGVDCEIEDVVVTGFYNGIVVSNVSLVTFRNCAVYRNAFRHLLLAHSDTSRIEGGRWATMLITNRNNIAECPYVFEKTPGSDGGDSGANLTIINAECWGPLLKTDGGNVTVIGCQVEDFDGSGIVHTNGGLVFATNAGKMTFIDTRFALALDNTNRNMFSLWSGAHEGLAIINPVWPRSRDMNPLANQLPRMFDIHGTNLNSPPYWSGGMSGPAAGQTQETYKNTRYNDTNYLHIKAEHADVNNQSTLRKNGRGYVHLDWMGAQSGANVKIGTTPITTGPWQLLVQPVFNDASDQLFASGVMWAGVNANAPWYFPMFTIQPNPDGTYARNFKITVPIISTNTFTNHVNFNIASIARDGSGTMWDGNSSGIFGYYSTTTNEQFYTLTRTFAKEPISQIGIRWGFNGSPWALTNGIVTGNPTIEYW